MLFLRTPLQPLIGFHFFFFFLVCLFSFFSEFLQFILSKRATIQENEILPQCGLFSSRVCVQNPLLFFQSEVHLFSFFAVSLLLLIPSSLASQCLSKRSKKALKKQWNFNKIPKTKGFFLSSSSYFFFFFHSFLLFSSRSVS